MRQLVIIASFGLAALLCGCAAVATSTSVPASSSLLGLTGSAAVHIQGQTDVRLAEANFVLVKTNVMGESGGFALLGLITIVPPRFNVALGRLYAQAGMQAGKPQTLAGMVFEKTSSYWILFSLPRYSLHANVVEFVPEQKASDAVLETGARN